MSYGKHQNYFGLGGGIGTGKSTVSDRFRLLGAAVLDADAHARHALDRDGCCYKETVALFGDTILRGDGSIDRKAVADRVFADEVLRLQLNAIVHPAVQKQMWEQASLIRPHIPVIFDVPLLFESGWHRFMCKNIVVTAPEPIRIRRVCARDGCSQEQVHARINAQMPQEEKRLLADYELQNDGDFESLYAQVDELYRILMEETKG